MRTREVTLFELGKTACRQVPGTTSTSVPRGKPRPPKDSVSAATYLAREEKSGDCLLRGTPFPFHLSIQCDQAEPGLARQWMPRTGITGSHFGPRDSYGKSKCIGLAATFPIANLHTYPRLLDNLRLTAKKSLAHQVFWLVSEHIHRHRNRLTPLLQAPGSGIKIRQEVFGWYNCS